MLIINDIYSEQIAYRVSDIIALCDLVIGKLTGNPFLVLALSSFHMLLLSHRLPLFCCEVSHHLPLGCLAKVLECSG